MGGRCLTAEVVEWNVKLIWMASEVDESVRRFGHCDAGSKHRTTSAGERERNFVWAEVDSERLNFSSVVNQTSAL
ncbi:MAG: hypothetical protein ACTS44_00815 [Candidatus Hodgkinia cicadicola]